MLCKNLHMPSMNMAKFDSRAYITVIRVFNHLLQSIRRQLDNEKCFKSVLKRFLSHEWVLSIYRKLMPFSVIMYCFTYIHILYHCCTFDSPIIFLLGMWFCEFDLFACVCFITSINVDLFCICRPSAGYGFMERAINEWINESVNVKPEECA
jgi:hypothetical protein